MTCRQLHTLTCHQLHTALCAPYCWCLHVLLCVFPCLLGLAMVAYDGAVAWGTAEVLVEAAPSPNAPPNVSLLVSGADMAGAHGGGGQDSAGREGNVVMLVAHLSPTRPLVLRGVVQNYSSAGGVTRLALSDMQLPAWLMRPAAAVSWPVSGAPAHPASLVPKYTYIIFKAEAAMTQRRITAYNGFLRQASLSPPLPFPAAATWRYLILPPSSILHAGMLAVSAPAGESDSEEQQGSVGGAECLLTLAPGASQRSSEYVGKILFVFLADGLCLVTLHTSHCTLACTLSQLWWHAHLCWTDACRPLVGRRAGVGRAHQGLPRCITHSTRFPQLRRAWCAQRLCGSTSSHASKGRAHVGGRQAGVRRVAACYGACPLQPRHAHGPGRGSHGFGIPSGPLLSQKGLSPIYIYIYIGCRSLD